MNQIQFEQKGYQMPPQDGFTVAHFLTVADIERSARFYETVFGGRIRAEVTARARQGGECPVVNNNPVSRCGGKNGLLWSPATGSFFQPTGKNETAPHSTAAGLRPLGHFPD
jgi:hypothetical protein